MESSANKAITIATAIFITIMITSGVLFSIGQMQNIYSQVFETDISIQNRFDEYDAYENTEKTGIDVVNAAKKYRDSNLINIKVEGIGDKLNESTGIDRLVSSIGNKPGEILYKSNVNRDLDKGKVTITFTKK